MNAVAKTPLPFNPEVLRWARERLEISSSEASKKANVAEEKIGEWESGVAAPTARQGRILAGLYERHFLEFFGKEIPVVSSVELVPDYRSFSGRSKTANEKRMLQSVQKWAEEKRLNALALLEEIGELPPVLSSNLRFNVTDDVEVAATIVREAMSFSIDEQMSLRSNEKHTLPNILRERIERMGVIVFKNSGLNKAGARGVCLFVEPLPVIVFGAETASAQAFTLIHEFAHVLLGKAGISGSPRFGAGGADSNNVIEDWCNRFSASFLIPKERLSSMLDRPVRPALDFDLAALSELAKVFSVSRHAMLIRLVNLGYVRSQFYWRTMRPVFQQEEAEVGGFGRYAYYGKRYVNSLGRFYTGLVLEAWGGGQITAHNAAEYMDIKNLEHIRDIRKDFGA